MTEVYSPVRVAEVAAKYGMRPGSSFDLTNGLDFTKEAHRARAWKQTKQEQPCCIIGSPPCTLLSSLQELSKEINKNNPEWQRRYEQRMKEAIVHV